MPKNDKFQVTVHQLENGWNAFLFPLVLAQKYNYRANMDSKNINQEDAQREQERIDALKRLWALRDSNESIVREEKPISFSREETYAERVR